MGHSFIQRCVHCWCYRTHHSIHKPKAQDPLRSLSDYAEGSRKDIASIGLYVYLGPDDRSAALICLTYLCTNSASSLAWAPQVFLLQVTHLRLSPPGGCPPLPPRSCAYSQRLLPARTDALHCTRWSPFDCHDGRPGAEAKAR